jgi:hypothetical protein
VVGLLALGMWVQWRAAHGRRNMALFVAFAALATMVMLLGLRTVSLHQIDVLLYGPTKLNWVIDIGASLTVPGQWYASVLPRSITASHFADQTLQREADLVAGIGLQRGVNRGFGTGHIGIAKSRQRQIRHQARIRRRESQRMLRHRDGLLGAHGVEAGEHQLTRYIGILFLHLERAGEIAVSRLELPETLGGFAGEPRGRPVLGIHHQHPIKETDRLLQLGRGTSAFRALRGAAVQDQVRLRQSRRPLVEEVVKCNGVRRLSFLRGGAERQQTAEGGKEFVHFDRRLGWVTSVPGYGPRTRLWRFHISTQRLRLRHAACAALAVPIG